MGMAASQARFLGLTARKTNVEYEGQQINQQRTTLGNQSANYYNQLLGMTVPVPPSISDYTKTVYKFTDGSLTNSISSMIAKENGEYLVSYTSTWTNNFAAIAAAPTIYTRTGEKPNYTYYVGAKELRKLGENIGNYTGNDEYLKTLSPEQIQALEIEEDRYLIQLNQKYGTENWMVRYVYNSTSKTWAPYFTKLDDLNSENTIYDDKTGASQSTIRTYTIGAAEETNEIKNITARLQQDASGRIINITLNPGAKDEVTYAVSTNTITDNDAYKDAMNQYEYDKYEYDQMIQEVNAKIEIVQAQDKNLELRLKQLDTEQSAIQTEMEAVSKIIEKNTESTFKTFG